MFSFVSKSLETKVIVALGLVLTVLLGLSSAFDVWFETRYAYKLAFKDLDTLANTIQKSLIKDMKDGKGSDVQEILEAVGTEKDILAVRIFSGGGRIIKSSRRSEIGMEMSGEDMVGYRAGLHDFVTEREGQKLAHIFHPIVNAPTCYGCHDRENEINGVLSLDYSLESVQGDMRSHVYRMAVLFFLTILLVGLAIYTLLKKMVNDPITGLKAAMAEAERGNLEVVIAATGEDEIGSLQKSFNRMLARIKELYDENLLQQKDLVNKEQELRMQQAIAQKNQALEAVNSEIVEKNRYYMEMLSFISHELKNPLVVLKGYTDLLIKEDLGALEPRQFEALDAMERNVDAIQEMIANYMDLSRMERGELKPDKRQVDLVDEVIKPVMAEYDAVLGKSSMTIRIEGPSRPVFIEADPAMMRSAIANLVSNAVKYGRPGSDIQVEVELVDAGVRVSVYNEGQGIPYEDLDRVFERFTRLDNLETRSQKGTGLGLYIVKEIMEMHGGTIWAESKQGAWTRIICALPASGGA
jgi:signal transduction histidine kinase